ncbi:MAG: site-specific integrase, partial [Actinomycetota bacterium]
PLVARYDQAERVHSPPLPFLFQRPWGLANHAITHGRVKELLDRTVISAGLTGADGKPVRFTPHDFRRIFATEAVASGLPVHIAAKILGHDTLATTQAYVAIYDNDVIDHHRAFIARRRSLRPGEEYREPTDAEWEEFLTHFERRKVELGVCGTPTAPHASTSTPASAAQCCARIPRSYPDSPRSSRTSALGSPKPTNADGSAKSKGSKPASPRPNKSSPACSELSHRQPP